MDTELKPLQIGDRVCKGPDWAWDDQGGADPKGTVTSDAVILGWVTVKWDNGETGCYRYSPSEQDIIHLRETVPVDTKETNPKDTVGAKKWRKTFFIPARVLWCVALAFLEGALKYGAFNWRVTGVKASVYIEAAENHVLQFKEGEDIDADSGLCHLDKAIASLIILRDGMIEGNWVDDRPPSTDKLGPFREGLQAQADALFERYPNPAEGFTELNKP